MHMATFFIGFVNFPFKKAPAQCLFCFIFQLEHNLGVFIHLLESFSYFLPYFPCMSHEYHKCKYLQKFMMTYNI